MFSFFLFKFKKKSFFKAFRKLHICYVCVGVITFLKQNLRVWKPGTMLACSFVAVTQFFQSEWRFILRSVICKKTKLLYAYTQNLHTYSRQRSSLPGVIVYKQQLMFPSCTFLLRKIVCIFSCLLHLYTLTVTISYLKIFISDNVLSNPAKGQPW